MGTFGVDAASARPGNQSERSSNDGSQTPWRGDGGSWGGMTPRGTHGSMTPRRDDDTWNPTTPARDSDFDQPFTPGGFNPITPNVDSPAPNTPYQSTSPYNLHESMNPTTPGTPAEYNPGTHN